MNFATKYKIKSKGVHSCHLELSSALPPTSSSCLLFCSYVLTGKSFTFWQMHLCIHCNQLEQVSKMITRHGYCLWCCCDARCLSDLSGASSIFILNLPDQPSGDSISIGIIWLHVTYSYDYFMRSSHSSFVNVFSYVTCFSIILHCRSHSLKVSSHTCLCSI